MKERFEGEAGRALLIEALTRQDAVEHDRALATLLADRGELLEFAPGCDIVRQGDCDNSVYFLLSGESDVFVNGRSVGARSDGTCVGEMAAIDSAATRSATVTAKGVVVALRVAEPDFRVALDAHPAAYKSIARLVASRLRQRSRFVSSPNSEPVLFIGCSAEALSLANKIQLGLKYDRIEVVVWRDAVFGASGTAFESLEAMADRSDFAAFVISPDDTVISRGHEEAAPRDNVIFELGLFMGRVARERVFVIHEHRAEVKIPSDLLGLTPLTYVSSDGSVDAMVAPVCSELRDLILKLGVR